MLCLRYIVFFFWGGGGSLIANKMYILNVYLLTGHMELSLVQAEFSQFTLLLFKHYALFTVSFKFFIYVLKLL